MDEINLNEVFLPSKAAAFRQIQGETVIVDTAQNKMLTLNETGSRIWSLLTGKTLDEVAMALANEFDVDSDVAKGDVSDFIRMLRERGLVEPKG